MGSLEDIFTAFGRDFLCEALPNSPTGIIRTMSSSPIHRQELSITKFDNIMKKIVIAFLVLFCCGCEAPPNQAQNQLSPSGQYVLSVPQKYQSKTKVWMVTIKSKDGSLLYQDDDSAMWWGANAYFGWDEQDRVWLYYSDDSSIWRWELVDGKWKKLPSSREDGMPDWILPDYEKSRR